MKIAGIIAEYNPFHNGHAYQIQTLKQETGADYVIAVMSGDFVQRGEPAIIDKYTRTRMALSNGIDLVIELPVLWSCASAEYFAAAGVSLLSALGCVDILCFGAETGSLSLLSDIADLLISEPEDFQPALLTHLKKGLPFPQARAAALADCSFSSDLLHALASPNNILAVEYLKALKRLSSSLTPYLIKREGAAYHDKDITQTYASASAIRKELLKSAPYCKSPQSVLEPRPNMPVSSKSSLPAFSKNCALLDALPKNVFSLLTDYATKSPFLSADDFSRPLGYLLLACDDLSRCADCTPDIAGRIQKNLFSYRSFSEFCALCKSRDVTYSRISRILLHLLLGHTNMDYTLYRDMGYTPYARILGFRKEQRAKTHQTRASTAPLLHKIKESSSLPLVPKLADAPMLLSSQAMRLLEKDIFAANLYEQIKYAVFAANAHHAGRYRSEYERQLVIV